MSSKKTQTKLPVDIGQESNGIKPSGKSTSQPSSVQIRYLRRGLDQAGGKLPLFDETGQQYSTKTIKACIVNGWATPWFSNPTKPDWLVCKLTDLGREIAK